jgi:hypothetical protein
MPSPVFFVVLLAISGITFGKKSPRPELKTFRDDYATVIKTCEAVGYVKDKCKGYRGKSFQTFPGIILMSH